MFVGGGLEDFKKVGEAFVRDFQVRCRLRPNERVLDVGCGVGRIAIPLTEFLNSDARYEGFDVVAKGIDRDFKSPRRGWKMHDYVLSARQRISGGAGER